MTDNTSTIDKCVLEQIDGIAKTCKEVNPLVAICCITYNHEPYIRDALEGFVMQKTNFPYVAIVHDDASIDDTAAIIREYAEKYPDIILPIFEKDNQYSKRDGSLGRIIQQARNATSAKYIAWCEGDDYWIDPCKLQKQADWLESNPDYSMCCTDLFRIEKDSNLLKECRYTELDVINNAILIKYNVIGTLTAMCRMHIVDQYSTLVSPKFKGFPLGDYPMWMWAASQGPIKHIKEYMAVYRVLPESASHSSDIFKKYHFNMAGFDIMIIMNEFLHLGYKGIKIKKLRAIIIWGLLRHRNYALMIKDSISVIKSLFK